VSTASSERARCAKDSDVALVKGLYRQVTAPSRAIRMPTSDRLMKRHIGDLAETTLALAAAPALNLADTILKLVGRLRLGRSGYGPQDPR